MNPHFPESELEQIKSDLRAGNKIAAIKRLREGSDMSLAEAKSAIEKLQAELHEKDAANYPAPKVSKGCLSALVILLVIVVTLSGFLLLVRLPGS
jgi:hypothetical protein